MEALSGFRRVSHRECVAFIESRILELSAVARAALGGDSKPEAFAAARQLAREAVKRSVGPALWSRYLNECDGRERYGRGRGGRSMRQRSRALTDLTETLDFDTAEPAH